MDFLKKERELKDWLSDLPLKVADASNFEVFERFGTDCLVKRTEKED